MQQLRVGFGCGEVSVMVWTPARRACPDCGMHLTGRLVGAPGVAFVCDGCLSVIPGWPTMLRQSGAALADALRRLLGGRG